MPLLSRCGGRCSCWFSTFDRRLGVDLERSAPALPTRSPIVMVPTTPARRDHLALIVTGRTQPASSCMAARKLEEQKRSIV